MKSYSISDTFPMGDSVTVEEPTLEEVVSDDQAQDQDLPDLGDDTEVTIDGEGDKEVE